MNQQNILNNNKEILEQYTNEVCKQLRSLEVVSTSTSRSKYMTLYNWTFEFKQDTVIQLKIIFENWLFSYLQKLTIPALLNSQNFIESFIHEWVLLKSLLRYFTIFFHNYEQLIGTTELFIVELGLYHFDKLVLSHDIIKQRFKQSFIDVLNQIRKTNNQNQKQQLTIFAKILDLNSLAQISRLEITSNDKEVLISVRQRIQRMANLKYPESTYDSLLFDSVQEGTKKFYSELSQEWIQTGSSTEYVQKATSQIEIEDTLKEQFYSKFTKQNEITKTFINELLEQKVDQIVSNPQDGMYQQMVSLKNSDNLSPISKIYQLYKNASNYIEKLLFEFQSFVKNQIQQILTESEENNQVQQQNPQQPRLTQQQLANRNLQIHLTQIENLQNFYEYCIRLVQICFEGSHRFRNNMELAFKEKLNQADRFMDKLSIYIHLSLKDKLKETSNEDDRLKFEKFNKNILSFIQLINSRGRLFLKITDNLKSRIFRGEIKNQGYEEEFLKSLRREHPEHLPSDLLTVWKDFKYYRNLDNEIQTNLHNQKILIGTNIQFTIFTRTNSLKEFSNQNRRDQVKPPLMIEQAINQMERFYQTKQQTEKKSLVWNYKIGQSTINYKFGPSAQQVGKIIVSNLQLFIIIYLKQHGGRTKPELLNDTGINYEEELTQQMENLLDSRIIVENQGKFFLQTEQSKLKVQIVPNRPLTLLPKRIGENSEDQIVLKKERDLKIQSSIVRLMKTNKEMLYPQIYGGVQRGLLGYYDFSSHDILAQIDELINANYIKRDDRINNKFLYTPV